MQLERDIEGSVASPQEARITIKQFCKVNIANTCFESAVLCHPVSLKYVLSLKVELTYIGK